MHQESEKINAVKVFASALAPVVLLFVFLFIFLKFGPLGVFKGTVPPIEDIFIQKVVFSPEHITVKVFNDGPESVTIAQALINDVYWQFTMSPSNTLKPLERGIVEFSYPWVEGDVERITLLSRNGVTFGKEVEVAFLTPVFNFVYFKTFTLLGIYVGVIPVLLGLLWFPFFKYLRKLYNFLLSLTVGLLVFLGVDALSESFELIGNLPRTFNGIGILAIGFFAAVLALSAVSYKTQFVSKNKEEHHQALAWGYLIALGIGLHNLGEGLAIGSAYAVGEIALGASLVIGFMIHNVTEGIAIIAPLTRTFKHVRKLLPHIIFMGLMAGVPTIFGALIGGFSYSFALGVFFLAIGAGAIFDVAFDITKSMAKNAWLSLFTVPNVLGFLLGLIIMYVTGFLVVG